MLIYIEFISRRPGVSLEAFHHVAGRGQTGWAADYADDEMLLALGRTWRVGPDPEYLCVWWTPKSGLERLDYWESEFRSGAADHVEQPFQLAARIDHAGCYEPLREPIGQGDRERFYAEYFDFADGAERDDVAAHFERRAAAHPELELHLLVDRIGNLGRGPRGLAVWSARAWAEIDAIARERHTDADPVRHAEVALYSTFGKETL